MKSTLTKIYKHPLISGSTVILIGSFSGNVINFLFNQQMIARLTPSDYGILASLLALIGLSSFAFGALGPIIVMFAGKFFAEKEVGKVKTFLFTIYKISFYISIPFIILFLLFLKPIGDFFHIQSANLLFISLAIVVLGLFSLINQSFLQARLSFGYITTSGFISSFFKLLIGIILATMGFGVSGAMYGVISGYFIAYIFTFFPLYYIFSFTKQAINIHPKSIISYSVQTAITLLSLTAFISTDIILAKHFYSSELAGLYAGLALFGKVVFYFTAPIGSVMFPLIVHKNEKNEDYTDTFLLALLLVGLPSLAIAVFYYLFPGFVIELFAQSKKLEYQSVANLIGYFALSMAIYSVLNIVANLYLSLKRTIIWVPLLCGAILQAILITVNHSSFFIVISISLAIESFLCVLLFGGYFFYIKGKS